MLRKVVDAVLALDEPYRSTITLRYFDELSPQEIARQLGVPVRTVKTRLRRALEQLQGRLDRVHGGDRGAWCLALLPLLPAPSASAGTGALTVGVLAMKKKLVVAAALICVAATLMLTWHASRAPVPAARRTTAREVGAGEGGDSQAGGGIGGEAPENVTHAMRTDPKPEKGLVSPTTRASEVQARPYRLAEASVNPEKGALRVIVTDEHAGPIAGVRVVVIISRNNVGMSGGDGLTDAAGQVAFPELEAEEFLAASVAVRDLWRSVNFGVLKHELTKGRVTELHIVVPAGVVVEGEVRHAETGPLPGVSVTASRCDGPYGDSVYAHSDEHGKYRMEGVPPGTYEVELEGKDIAFNECKQGELAVQLPGPVRKDYLLGELSLHGFVFDAKTKRPLPGASVTVWRPKYASTRTGPHGEYHFTGLAAGKCSISIRKEGYAVGHVYDVVLAAGELRRRDFPLETSAILHLYFTDAEGRPLPGRFPFSVKGEPHGGFSTTVTADGEGHVRYTTILPGRYTMTVKRSGMRAAPKEVELKPGENTVRFKMERTAPPGVRLLHGTVRDATTRRPVPGVQVFFESYLRVTFTDAQGRYAFENMTPGKWKLHARKDGYGDLATPAVEIVKGKERKLDLELRPAATLLLRVLDWKGHAVPARLLLIFTPQEGGQKASGYVETDTDGRAAYHRVLPGRYRLIVAWPAHGRARTEVVISAGENFAEVRLEES
jgi:protocatechuate 3,4-dioxygenase beta subunit